MQTPYIKLVLNSAITLFCIKSREYKITSAEHLSIFVIIPNCQKKSKVLKSARGASCDFTWI